MHIYTLRCEMLTRSTLQETFAVFENPYNLSKITPAWLSFNVTSKGVEMRAGAEITYTIKWLGVPMRWKTIIREYQPPFLFVDEQAEGPYALWRHRHTFSSESEDTRVADRVEYALPFGPLGRLAHALIVKKQLEAIFRYRQRELGKILGGKIVATVEPSITVQS
jgi:ligand-binding SRPBCC domain-containing protein